ncbi:hypothetical protein FJZ31_25365 [Candidatus Poribacteria bacterium]|nr:hypothetical protein [Candidatus Poribacteria bacterium]
MARRRRSKVIRNFTEKTALDTVVKARERISGLETEITKLRKALVRCRNFFEIGPPGASNEWVALRDIVSEALGE